MATECWLGLLMGPDGSSTLWEGSWVSPNVVIGALAPKTTEGEKETGNIEYICMQSLIIISIPYFYFPLPLSSVPSSIYQNI